METISLIGAGGMPTAISTRIAKAGYPVEVINHNLAKAKALAEQLQLGATSGTYGEAPKGDIVILAVPYPKAAAVVKEFGTALKGKILVDITNPINSDATGFDVPPESSGAQEIAKAAPAGVRVVKAFNSLFGHVLARGGKLDALIAADDKDAKARVSALIAKMGLRPLDVGGINMAQTLEAVGLLLINLAKNGAGSFDIALNIEPVKEK